MIDMKVLITGGAGYIGSVIHHFLQKRGHAVAIIDNLETCFYPQKIENRPQFYKGKIQNKIFVRELLQRFTPDIVIHLAAYASVKESYINPMKYYENNVVGSISFINECLEAGVKKFIFSSTCSVYGDQGQNSLDETCQVKPGNPYAETKLVIENFFRYLAISDGITSVNLRFFNVSGATSDGQLGEIHQEELHLIPNIIKNALTNTSVHIFGSDYQTDDGTCIRDYISVVDIAEAHIASMDAVLDNQIMGFNVFNVGTGQGYSNLDVVRVCEKLLSKKIKITLDERRPGDPAYLVANPEKIERIIGFKAQNSSLDKIISSYLLWYNNFFSNREK